MFDANNTLFSGHFVLQLGITIVPIGTVVILCVIIIHVYSLHILCATMQFNQDVSNHRPVDSQLLKSRSHMVG